MDLILGIELPLDELSSEQVDIIESAADTLYGLIHARFINTSRGMSKMYDKYRQRAFGVCPRILCQAQPCLPVGLSDSPSLYAVSLFCPSCVDCYFPRSSKYSGLDGAYFGTNFPHLFLLNYPDLIPKQHTKYVPRIYGFKVNKNSEYYLLRERKDKITTDSTQSNSKTNSV